MKEREILISLAVKFSGKWDDIYSAIQKKELLEEDEMKKLYQSVKSDCVTILDNEYPESLRRIYKPPFVLFYHGDISLISDNKNKLAVIGSRDYSTYGKKTTRQFVSTLANDFVIVSGLARGIDSIAQATAIESGGKTVGVLGNGINIYYLKDTMELYQECKRNHLVLSEYPNDTPPIPDNFPIRNRIIAGLCDTLLITEGKINSGTQVTAMLMSQKDGNVCCVPTQIGEDSICNHLISEGAFLVERPEDIYEIAKVAIKKPVFEN